MTRGEKMYFTSKSGIFILYNFVNLYEMIPFFTTVYINIPYSTGIPLYYLLGKFHLNE